MRAPMVGVVVSTARKAVDATRRAAIEASSVRASATHGGGVSLTLPATVVVSRQWNASSDTVGAVAA